MWTKIVMGGFFLLALVQFIDHYQQEIGGEKFQAGRRFCLMMLGQLTQLCLCFTALTYVTNWSALWLLIPWSVPPWFLPGADAPVYLPFLPETWRHVQAMLVPWLFKGAAAFWVCAFCVFLGKLYANPITFSNGEEVATAINKSGDRVLSWMRWLVSYAGLLAIVLEHLPIPIALLMVAAVASFHRTMRGEKWRVVNALPIVSAAKAESPGHQHLTVTVLSAHGPGLGGEQLIYTQCDGTFLLCVPLHESDYTIKPGDVIDVIGTLVRPRIDKGIGTYELQVRTLKPRRESHVSNPAQLGTEQ